jgi:magnesium transporter
MAHRRRRRRRPRHRDLAASIAVATQPSTSPATLRLVACDGTNAHESIVQQPAALAAERDRWPVLWIDVEGLDDLAMIREIGQIFGIGDLALEDAVTPDERPKVEVFGHQVLIAVRMARYEGDTVVTDPMAIFLGDRYVITFHERSSHDGFEGLRQRIRQHRTRLGELGADHLCALLLDAVIDGYFPVLERFGDQLEELEDEALESPSRGMLVQIHDVRNDLMTLRRALWPTRDVLHTLGRETTAYVGDHAMELLDLMESYREIGSDLRDIYLASLNNRMNDVMKVLTVIATVFMPLTFITGFYGMNFDTGSPWNMPLLRFRFGALVAMGMMVATTIGMVIFFWRRGWLRRWH